MTILSKDITYCDQPVTMSCDARCEKAWGSSDRPRVNFSTFDLDDFAWLADDELGTAPVDPGTYEGGHAKPTSPEERMNKWCARSCERCRLFDRGRPVVLRSFEKRVYNQPWKHEEASQDSNCTFELPPLPNAR